MKVDTERTTARGDNLEDTLQGDRLVNPPGTRPTLDGDTVLGEMTAIKELDGGSVAIADADGEVHEFEAVLDVMVPPMLNKARVTFIAASSEMVPLGSILHATTPDDT